VTLFANGDFLASISVAVISVLGGAVAAGVPVWLKYRLEREQHKADSAAARVREQQFEEEVLQLKESMTKLVQPILTSERQVDIQEMTRNVRVLADTVAQLRQDVADLRHRCAAMATIEDTLQGLRQQVAKLEQRVSALEQPLVKQPKSESNGDDCYGCWTWQAEEETFELELCANGLFWASNEDGDEWRGSWYVRNGHMVLEQTHYHTEDGWERCDEGWLDDDIAEVSATAIRFADGDVFERVQS
jgi:hypothetical protein